MTKTKNLVIIGLAFLAVGFWWNLVALQAYIAHSPLLKVFGDILPFELSIGDCFLFLGYPLLGGLLLYRISCAIGDWIPRLRKSMPQKQ